jgi:plastocyanin
VRRLLYLVALSILALLMFVSTAGAWQKQAKIGHATPKVWSVSIEDFYFEPANAAVQPGDTIVFINKGNHPHTVTADDGSFDSGTLQPGQSFWHKFQNAGTVSYHCSIHPFMTGSVVVDQSGGGAAPSTSQPSMSATPVGEAMPMGSGYSGY